MFPRLIQCVSITLISLALANPPKSCACSAGDMQQVGSEQYFPLVYGDSPTVDQLLNLGRKAFFDEGLSASGKLSCASCHSPAAAFGSPNGLMTQPGGPALNRTGYRNTPSLRYIHSPVAFTEHFYETEVTGGKDDEGPTGGRTWDGRVNTGHQQALMPLLDANEMANQTPSEIAARVAKAPYAAEFQKYLSAPNENVLDNPEAVVAWLTVALEMFEQSPADFHPFSSKFDAYLRDQVELSQQEKRGLLLFNDEKKGNCASCHTSSHKNPASHLPIFTDFGYVALAVPRNKQLAANADPAFFDLGICGPLRTDLTGHSEYCGLFRTPSLRNVALRKRFFHNGVFTKLHDVVDFYVTRDTQPQKWYAKGADGKVNIYDDLPAQYQQNINHEPPFAPLPGNKPRLTPSEIDDVVAFLQTLSDGFVVPKTGIKTAAR